MRPSFLYPAPDCDHFTDVSGFQILGFGRFRDRPFGLNAAFEILLQYFGSPLYYIFPVLALHPAAGETDKVGSPKPSPVITESQ